MCPNPPGSREYHSAEYEKDSRFKTIVAGYVVPALILAVVTANFIVGRVYLLAGRYVDGDMLDGMVQSTPIGLRFAGVVMVKLGLAVGLFAWHAIANHQRTEHLTHYGLLVSATLTISGLTAYAISWFN